MHEGIRNGVLPESSIELVSLPNFFVQRASILPRRPSVSPFAPSVHAPSMHQIPSLGPLRRVRLQRICQPLLVRTFHPICHFPLLPDLNKLAPARRLIFHTKQHGIIFPLVLRFPEALNLLVYCNLSRTLGYHIIQASSKLTGHLRIIKSLYHNLCCSLPNHRLPNKHHQPQSLTQPLPLTVQ